MNKIQKDEISHELKSFTKEEIEEDYNHLMELGKKQTWLPIDYNRKYGMNTVDFFTFTERLNTKGNKNVTFFEMLEHTKELKTKHYVKNIFTH